MTSSYMHFQVASSANRLPHPPRSDPVVLPDSVLSKLLSEPPEEVVEAKSVAQWVNCDIRSFDYSVLGQYVPNNY